MSEAPVVPVVPAAVETPAAAPPVVETPEAVAAAEPPWAKARVERGAREVIKKAGVKLAKDDSVEKGVAAINAKVDSQRERRKAAEAERDEARAESAGMKNSIAALTAMQGLNEAQRALITKLAGADPLKQIEQISIMQSIEAMKPPPAVETPAAVDPAKPIASPAQSAPAAGSPAPPAPPGTPSPRDEYTRLRSDPMNQLLAAQYLLDHRGAIVPTS